MPSFSIPPAFPFLSQPGPAALVVERVQSSFSIMEKYYSTFVFEDYLEMFVEELRGIKKRDEKYLLDFFQEFSNAERYAASMRPFSG